VYGRSGKSTICVSSTPLPLNRLRKRQTAQTFARQPGNRVGNGWCQWRQADFILTARLVVGRPDFEIDYRCLVSTQQVVFPKVFLPRLPWLIDVHRLHVIAKPDGVVKVELENQNGHSLCFRTSCNIDLCSTIFF
jgi:hypothetical protein